MIPRAQILSALQASTPVTTLAGSRLYAGKIPAGSGFPCVCWNLISSVPENTHEKGHDFGSHAFQFDCQANTLAEAANLAEAVQVALEAGAVPVAIDAVRDGVVQETDRFVVSVDATFYS